MKTASSNGISQAVRLAFFGRFGGKLRPFQHMAIQELAAQGDCIVIAQTGGGKTEAVFAPVAQQIIDAKRNGAKGLLALVISPTRALAGDLHRRMAGKFEKLGIQMDVATSDYRSIGRKPTEILIRTPEGLENDLLKCPSKLAQVRVVVIDELHRFLDDPRGTQLCGELARLATISEDHIRVGISATIPDISVPGRSGILREPKVIRDDSDTSQTDIVYFDWLEEDSLAAKRLVCKLRELGVKKAIGFATRKADVETFAHLLDHGYLKGKTYPHHANLSSADRKRIEQFLRTLPCALVVSTTTLEVGIDIGDIDTCVLFTPPPDQKSFLQRIGRAGRRSGKRRVICVCGRGHRRSEYASVATGSQGKNGDARPFLAGYLQQVLAFVTQNDGTSCSELLAFSKNAYKLPSEMVHLLLGELNKDGFLSVVKDSIEPADELQKLIDSGNIIKTFAGSGGTPVVEESTGRFLGRAALGSHTNILLAGKGRNIRGVHPQTGVAIVSSAKSGIASFSTARKSVFENLAARYEKRVGRVFRIE